MARQHYISEKIDTSKLDREVTFTGTKWNSSLQHFHHLLMGTSFGTPFTLLLFGLWCLVGLGDNDANSAPLESKLTFTKIVLIVATIFA